MTPYNLGAIVAIDPNIKNLFFGNVSRDFYKKLGTIKSRKEIVHKKFMSYDVLFEGETELISFKESELMVIYS
jgi:hypothetical protein